VDLHSGHMCYACQAGAWRAQAMDSCSTCPPREVQWSSFVLTWGISFVACFILGAMSMDAALWGHMHAVIMRMLVNHAAVMVFLGSFVDWELEPLLGKDGADSVAALMTVLSFGGGVPRATLLLDCIFRSDTGTAWEAAQMQFVFWLLCPLASVIACIFASIVVFELGTWGYRLRAFTTNSQVVLKSIQQIEDPYTSNQGRGGHSTSSFAFKIQDRVLCLFRQEVANAKFADRVLLTYRDIRGMLLICFYLVWPPTFQFFLSMVHCRDIGDGAGSRLLIAPEVMCWEGDHTPFGIGAILLTLLLGIGFPLFLADVGRSWQMIEDDPRWKSIYMFFADGYEDGKAWWEALPQLRRAVCFLIPVLPVSRETQLGIFTAVMLLLLALHVKVKPFDNRAYELLDRLELYSLMLAAYLGLTLLVCYYSLPYYGNRDTQLLPVIVSMASMALVMMHTRLSFLFHQFLGKFVLLLWACLFLYVYLGFQSTAESKKAAVTVLFFGMLLMHGCFAVWCLGMMSAKVKASAAEGFVRSKVKLVNAMLAEAKKDADHHTDGQPTWTSRGRSTGSNDMNQVKQILSRKETAAPLELAVAAVRDSKMESCYDSMMIRMAQSRLHRKEAVVRLDHHTGSLILGLHPDALESEDGSISMSARKLLAESGPFLSIDERGMVAMSLYQALQHVLVECALEVISTDILEFLIRWAFAAKYRRERVTEKMHQKHTVEKEPGKVGLEVSAAGLLKAKIAERGMTAEQFQSELLIVNRMDRKRLEEELADFIRLLRAKEKIVLEERAARAEQPVQEGNAGEGDDYLKLTRGMDTVPAMQDRLVVSKMVDRSPQRVDRSGHQFAALLPAMNQME